MKPSPTQIDWALKEWRKCTALSPSETAAIEALQVELVKGVEFYEQMARVLWTMEPGIMMSAVTKARLEGIGKEWPVAEVA